MPLLGLSLPAHAGEVFVDEAQTQERVKAIQASISALRGLESRSQVQVLVEDPATMRARMEEEIAEQLDEKTRLGIEQTWLALGLVEPGFDVADAYATVLEDAVGGYFDVEQGRLVLVRRDMGGTGGGLGQVMEDMVIAHELVHGLQDQHFDLWSLSHRELGNEDAAVAVQSLIEGDASYAMLFRLPMGLNPDMLDLKALKKMMKGAGGPSADPGGELGSAPRIMRENLLFPYVDGLAFAQAVKKRGTGWSQIDAAFASPPLSTEQILHPERYGPDGDWPTHFAASAEGWLPGFEEIQQETFGELGIAIVLRDKVPTIDASEVADGWDGDRVWTLHDGDQTVLVWRSTWDSQEDATAFARAAGSLAMKLDAAGVPAPGKRHFVVRGEAESRVDQRGHDVVVVLGAPRKAKRLVRKAMKVDGMELRRLDQLAPSPPRPDTAPDTMTSSETP